MSGRHSRNFLKGLSNTMDKNTIVRKGWYYRRSPIFDENNQIGLIVKHPVCDIALVEKLKYSKKSDSWSIIDLYEETLVAEVLWNNSVVEKWPLLNLVEVK